jgi:hypothetical protein
VRAERALSVAFVLATAPLVKMVAALAVRPGSRSTGPAARRRAGVADRRLRAQRHDRHPVAGSPEPVDVVGLATKTVEALGLAFVLRLSSHDG